LEARLELAEPALRRLAALGERRLPLADALPPAAALHPGPQAAGATLRSHAPRRSTSTEKRSSESCFRLAAAVRRSRSTASTACRASSDCSLAFWAFSRSPDTARRSRSASCSTHAR